MMRRTKRRPTIGMLICVLDADYQAKVWNNIAAATVDYDINLLIFVGKGLSSPVGYESRHNIVYNLAGEQSLDGLIILSSTIGNYIPHAQLIRFCKQFQSVKGIPSVMFDNEAGVRELIDHLVLVHGYKRIAFIKGTDTIQDAMIRYDTYKKALHKHHIVFDPNLVAPGDFGFDSGEEAMRILFEERRIRCEAVVASNDEMALGAYRYLQEKNIRVPQDMALAGFDDTKLVKNLGSIQEFEIKD